MAEKEDLGLSLSLATSDTRFPLKLTLFPSLTTSSSPSKTQCTYSDEEEAGAWSPVSTLSGHSGKRYKREENEGEELDGDNSPKKLRLSKDQSAILEESFKENSTLNPKQKQALAKQLNLRPRQVEVWFQNRRARTKLKHTEVECGYLKRWCEKLAEENKRLQEEVMELRAVNKVSSNSIVTNTNLSSSSSSSLPFQLQLLSGHQLNQNSHLNVSAGADSNPWGLYFPQASRYHSS